ncbi:MAG: Asp-tRNA(Asn)/Glu-tRNA(Gln) amidotransferase subunit GatC [Elusimicrobia bacterium]|nr:Asp-tRNA(Asn)/Glu-tRNA(Gln) amidotransferase subunit GatC [Elusimicrobiota bacterium]
MIGDETVAAIAKLARLALSAEEAALYRGQLGSILDHVAALSEADTEGVAPTAGVLGLDNVLRDDARVPFDDPEAILANAPGRDGPYVKVRKVL